MKAFDLSISRSLLEASWPNREEELHSTCSYPQPLLNELGPDPASVVCGEIRTLRKPVS